MRMTDVRDSHLKIVAELGGLRHILDGQPIHAGDVLEFYDGDRMTWTLARFELLVGERGRRAVLCTADGSSLAVDETIRLRWPTRR